MQQRHKKSKLSGRQNSTRKNFPDGVRKSFLRHMCQKCVNCFRDIYASKVPKSLSRHTRQSAKTLLTKVQDVDVAKVRKTIIVLDSLEIFRTIWKVSRLSRNFQDCVETFQTVHNFPNCLETLHTVQKLSRLSRNFPDLKYFSN